MPTDEMSPDAFRMTIGEHLEELRTRLIFALVGFGVIAGLCFFFGQQVLAIFCRPLITVFLEKHLNPQLFYSDLSEGFMVYIKISLISAATLAAPWVVYQIWKFVAAGLYPHERKYVTRYIPLSIGLLIGGFVFVYFVVLPWTIYFFVSFGNSIRMPSTYTTHVATNVPTAGLPTLPQLNGDPTSPKPGAFWFNVPESRLKFDVGDGDIRVIQFGPSNLLSPHISIGQYINLVMDTLLTFGLCFQLPIIVLTAVKIRIVNIQTLRTSRRYIYFGISLVAAAMTPGDMITAMIALMAPLILLYELGIVLAAWKAPVALPVTEGDGQSAPEPDEK